MTETNTVPAPTGDIHSYHAHIYFKDATERAIAETLRNQISERFSVQMGRWHDRLVGPHALPMYQVAFGVKIFDRLVPWLMLNRQGLTILLHPDTGHPRRDHLVHPFWFGEVLPIMNVEQLPEVAGEFEVVTPNTAPSI